MKNLLLLAGLASPLAPARAQDHPAAGPIISVGVYGLSANVGLQIEQRVGRHFSLGAFATRQFNLDFRGYQGALVGRYYFRPAAPTGLYLQATASIFDAHATIIAINPGGNSRSERTVKGSGVGLGLGYQWRFAQHLVATIGLGVKALPNGLGTCSCAYERDWYAVGQPGSVLDGQLSVGYVF